MKKYLFLFTAAYFLLGIINIHFAALGLICMITPFVLLVKYNKKIWCQNYCPRASLFTACGKMNPKGPKAPGFITQGNMKWIMLTYFSIGLFLILFSTIKVAAGSGLPVQTVKFLMMFQLPFSLPQLFFVNGIPPFITHFCYQFYSMMVTTTILGLFLAVFYKPRTWCAICPVSTVSMVYLKSNQAN